MQVRCKDAKTWAGPAWVLMLLGLCACGEEPRPAGSPTDSGEPAADQAPWTFTDVTRAAGVDFRYTFGDDQFSFILEDTGSGCAVLDYDGDGFLDLYLLNGCWLEGVSDPGFQEANQGATNRLYRNRGDFTFEDVTGAAGVGDPGYGMGAVVGDYDGDGDEDLYVLNRGPNVLYRNEGDGTFADVTRAAGVPGPERLNEQLKWSVNGFFFDADGDGWLDLYVANYLAFDPAFVDPDLPPEYPYSGPESYRGQASLLYRNRGDGTFEHVTDQVGLWQPDGKTMGAAPGDLDGDGDLDLFEAADDAGNLLFRNDGGRFVEVGQDCGVAFDPQGKPMASMHASLGDMDGDGDLDVFVPDLARGCLYENLGGWRFQDVTTRAGLGDVLEGRGAWGSQFEDFDNDGDLDLLVVLGGAFDLQDAHADVLFLNDGTGRFVDVSADLGGYFGLRNVSRGAAFADLDNDGDVDFVVSRKDVAGTVHLVRNDLPPGRHWLTLQLVGAGGLRDPSGARVELTAGGRTQVREAGRAGSYLSSCDPRVHFGLGAAAEVEALTVRWPSGRTQQVAVTGVDRILLVTEDEALPDGR